jgi:hypothetical protein
MCGSEVYQDLPPPWIQTLLLITFFVLSSIDIWMLLVHRLCIHGVFTDSTMTRLFQDGNFSQVQAAHVFSVAPKPATGVREFISFSSV